VGEQKGDQKGSVVRYKLYVNGVNCELEGWPDRTALTVSSG
jgi:hypothetical protein